MAHGTNLTLSVNEKAILQPNKLERLIPHLLSGYVIHYVVRELIFKDIATSATCTTDFKNELAILVGLFQGSHLQQALRLRDRK